MPTAKGCEPAIDAGVASLPADAWVRASGWDISAFPDASAAVLDEITGARPAYLAAADGHSAWVNSAALKAAGIDAATKAPEGGRIEHDAAGKPNGVLRESAMELVSKLLPDYPDSQVDAGLAKALQEAYSYGITAIIDPAAKEWMLNGYQRFDAAGKLSLRVTAAVKSSPPKASRGVARILGLRTRYASPHLEMNSAKLFVDGVIETGTAALLEAYVGGDQRGDLLFTPEAMKQIATAADAAGLQLHAHAIGDRAVRATLDAYEAARTANGPRDSRHQITHLELIDPADIPRFKSAAGAGQHPGAVGLSRQLHRRSHRTEDRPGAVAMALSVRRPETGRRHAGRKQRLERVLDEPARGDAGRGDPAGSRRCQRSRTDAAASPAN